MKIMFTIFSLVALLIAIFCFAIGGAVLTKKKPLILSSRWFFSFLVLVFAPTIAKGGFGLVTQVVI